MALLGQQLGIEFFNKLALVAEQLQFINEIFHHDEDGKSRSGTRRVVLGGFARFLRFIHSAGTEIVSTASLNQRRDSDDAQPVPNTLAVKRWSAVC